MSLEQLREKNPQLDIQSIFDDAFRSYGRVVSEFDFSQAIDVLKASTSIPNAGCAYEPDIEPLHAVPVTALIRDNVFGGMPIQAGTCNGMNRSLGALEYHKNSEVVVAGTDLAVMVGHVYDIVDGQYASERAEIFFVPANTAIEFYATTLHFAPCETQSDGFCSIIYLPKGTNTEMDFPVDPKSEGAWLTHRNKWIIAHPESADLIASGAKQGITGPNLTLNI